MQSMEAIYQRARPATFAEVVGQDHVKDILAAALARGRTGHAYLFSGPRGVGKTTTARLLAMALNCEAEAGEAKPCGTCEACTSIRAGQHADVTELDAASNNSVEDVRDMRERVRLASMHGGTRVWILDEAHMLSTAAANALLKTLEEPPPGLVFVLATTEPERLPPTVLSRCQHFRFRRLSETEILGKLQSLCETAGVEAEEDALTLVARAADGAMRDAESLLERLWAADGPIQRDAVEDALGLPPRERLERLAAALAGDDVATLLQDAGALYRDGFAPRTVAEQLARVLRDAVWNDATGSDGFTVSMPREGLLAVLHQFDDELDRFVRQDDLYALEATLLKARNAAHATAAAPTSDAADDAVAHAVREVDAAPVRKPNAAEPPASEKPAAAPSSEGAAPPARDASAGSQAEDAEEHEPAPAAATPPTSTPASEATPSEPAQAPAASGTLRWHDVQAGASTQLKAFLKAAEETIADGTLTLRYSEQYRFHFGQIAKRQDELAALVAEVAGPGWTIVLEGPDETIRKKA